MILLGRSKALIQAEQLKQGAIVCSSFSLFKSLATSDRKGIVLIGNNKRRDGSDRVINLVGGDR